jgi:hypothetical protein
MVGSLAHRRTPCKRLQIRLGCRTVAAAHRPPTLHDVARRAGVHPATVSRALSERTRHMVNAATAERVLAGLKENRRALAVLP